MVELPLHVGVEQRGVAFAAPPERVAGAAELVGDLHGLLHLRGGEGEDVEVGAGGRPVHVARIAEQVRGAPEQLDAGTCLLVLEDLDDLVEVGVALLEGPSLGGDVAVVEGVERHPELLEELEGDLGLALGVGDRVRAVVPGPQRRADAEGIGQRVAEGVPVDDREPEMLLHRLVADDLVGVVMLELQRITRLGSAVRDLRDVGKEGGHRLVSPCVRPRGCAAMASRQFKTPRADRATPHFPRRRRDVSSKTHMTIINELPFDNDRDPGRYRENPWRSNPVVAASAILVATACPGRGKTLD